MPEILIERADERNQLNMGLFNIVLTNDAFYSHAQEGKAITIDKGRKIIAVEGCDLEFTYEHAPIEEELLSAGGILPLYKIHGKKVFSEIIMPRKSNKKDLRSRTISMEAFNDEIRAEKLSW